MGGTPLATFLSMAVPNKLPQRWVDEFLEGLLKLATQFAVPLAGGDTAMSPGKILADIVVLGSVPRGKAVPRSGAKPGHRIYVTGTLGGSATTLRMLLAGQKNRVPAADLNKYFYPFPRLEVGHFLRERGLASAMIDISDGLSTDLAHICEESGVGAEIIADAIPRPSAAKSGEKVDLLTALHGGEDYELLFTAAANKRVPAHIAGIPITRIGHIIPGRQVFLTDQGKIKRLLPQGWEHFRKMTAPSAFA
jgi:thiamine-monophosphate kinase